VAVAGRLTARALERAARAVAADAVAYLSPFENHPALVEALSRGRVLWGNPPDVLRRVRDPHQLAAALRRRGLPAPASLNPAPGAQKPAPDARLPAPGARGAECNARSPKPAATAWLVKPLRSGGGLGVRRWRPGRPVPRGWHLQSFIAGEPGSVVFVASAAGAVTLGISRQLTGDPAFGASGFGYCGSILDSRRDVLYGRVETLAQAVAEEFGLVGVNGIDFILRGDEPVAIEVNPRWSASMELVERACGSSIFGVHAAACRSGHLPPAVASARGPGATLAGASGAFGKAIVFARQTVTLGDTSSWREDVDIRDVPHPGERIAGGRPVCTVFASASDADACYARLKAKASRIQQQLAGWRRSVA
jgi:predicted ATP-grasp superfamily ATP-dependent carboligase